MSTIDYNLTRENDEGDEEVYLLTVEYCYHSACRGYRNSLGVPEEPDEPAGVEIDSIVDADGNEFEVSEEEEEKIYAACMNDVEDY